MLINIRTRYFDNARQFCKYFDISPAKLADIFSDLSFDYQNDAPAMGLVDVIEQIYDTGCLDGDIIETCIDADLLDGAVQWDEDKNMYLVMWQK